MYLSGLQSVVSANLDLTTAGVDVALACRSADVFPAEESRSDIDLCTHNSASIAFHEAFRVP